MKNWNTILKRLEYWHSQDQKWQDAMSKFCETIAPDSYEPIIQSEYVESFIAGVDIDGDGSWKSLGGWLSYWLYEASTMSDCEVKDEKGRKYDFKKRKDVVKFFKNNF